MMSLLCKIKMNFWQIWKHQFMGNKSHSHYKQKRRFPNWFVGEEPKPFGCWMTMGVTLWWLKQARKPRNSVTQWPSHCPVTLLKCSATGAAKNYCDFGNNPAVPRHLNNFLFCTARIRSWLSRKGIVGIARQTACTYNWSSPSAALAHLMRLSIPHRKIIFIKEMSKKKVYCI